MKQPWELNPALMPEHLIRLASLMRNVRDGIVDLHDDELGDSARSTGMRAYECCRTQIIRASMDFEEWPWLRILRDDGKFTFSISSVPVRLYRGQPSNPEERRMIPCVEAVRQMSLLPDHIGDAASVLWFFAIELDESRYVERITFTGYLDDVQVSCWEIPLDEKVVSMSSSDSELPEAVILKKAAVGVKKKKDSASDDNVGNG